LTRYSSASKFKVRVEVATRPTGAAKALTARGVEVVKADLLEPSSLKPSTTEPAGPSCVTNFGTRSRGREEEIGASAVNAARSLG